MLMNAEWDMLGVTKRPTMRPRDIRQSETRSLTRLTPVGHEQLQEAISQVRDIQNDKGNDHEGASRLHQGMDDGSGNLFKPCPRLRQVIRSSAAGQSRKVAGPNDRHQGENAASLQQQLQTRQSTHQQQKQQKHAGDRRGGCAPTEVKGDPL